MKKLLLTFLLLITAWATASAYDFMVDGIAYNFNSDGKSVTVTHNSQGLPILDCYSNYTGSISIPVTVTYEGTTYSVTSIDMMAFSRCTGLTSVTIPNSIKQIEQGAFKGCSGLTEVTIPKSVTSLYAQAFADCIKLTTVNFNAENCSHSDIVYDDGNDEYPSIFAGCPLKNLNIGDSVTKIPAYLADGQSGLTSVTIPNSVTSIGYHAFEGCSGLTSIVVASGNRNYDSRNNCNAIIETESNTLIQGCNNTVIPESVTSIGGKAFYGCRGLTSVTIPKSVTEIGNDAFGGCSGLTSIVVASGNRNYDSRNNCNAIIETASNRLIIGCNNTVIPESVTRIGCSAFIGCSQMTEITIPSSVSVIEFEAGWDYDSGPEEFYRSCHPFNGCTGLKKVNYNAVRCELVNIMPRGDADYLPLFGSNLNTLNIGSSVQAIPNGLVSGCSGLTSVTIPNSVTSIGYDAFSGCSGLTEINSFVEVPPAIKDYTFDSNTYTTANLYVPEGCVDAYKAADVWKRFLTITELSNDGLKYIKNSDGKSVSVTYDYENPEDHTPMPTYSGDISIPPAVTLNGINYTVTGIGDNAFKNCANLKSVTIPNTVTTIGKSAFNDCTALSQLAIPASVSAIGNYAFTGCTAMSGIMVDGSNESYCSVDGVLHDKAKTKVVAYPNLHGSSYRVIDSVKEIGIGAFNNCPDLTTVIIPDGVTAIGSSAFTHCGKLRVVSIGRGMTSIGSSVFAYCTSMGAVTIPASVTSIGGNAFAGCTGLTSVTSLRETPVKINASVFQDVPVATATLLVPDGCSTVYGSTAVWKDFGTIEELPNMKGDVNGDGKVDVKDINIVINIILGQDTAGNYSGADVNGDNKVDIVDLNTVINIILGM